MCSVSDSGPAASPPQQGGPAIDAVPERTWDGLPVAQDAPRGAQVVVHRPRGRGSGESEYLILHRAQRGPDYAGDWAWTPPSGARQPGEPVLCGALRELAEETGITSAELLPVDLSGGWAVFPAGLPAGTSVRLDSEHDAFAWLSADEAARRCLPEQVTAAFRQAVAVPSVRIAFRPLAENDLPDLVEWMHAPHAARWFSADLDLSEAQRKYIPRIEGRSPTRMQVVLIGGRARGFLQHYRLRDYPDYCRAAGDQEAAGVDYLIGAEELTGRGLGPQMIWSYLRQVVFAAHPDAPRVVASPELANHRSIRALEKAGFRQAGQIAGEVPGKPEMVCVLDRQRIFG
jgi:RimJ/RimL family protein N-acetyltransferase